MDVISAIKSGKRFKYQPDHSWFEPIDLTETTFRKLEVPVTWLVSNTWEIEEHEPVITINRAELLKKIRPVLKDFDKAKMVAQALGLD